MMCVFLCHAVVCLVWTIHRNRVAVNVSVASSVFTRWGASPTLNPPLSQPGLGPAQAVSTV